MEPTANVGNYVIVMEFSGVGIVPQSEDYFCFLSRNTEEILVAIKLQNAHFLSNHDQQPCPAPGFRAVHRLRNGPFHASSCDSYITSYDIDPLGQPRCRRSSMMQRRSPGRTQARSLAPCANEPPRHFAVHPTHVQGAQTRFVAGAFFGLLSRKKRLPQPA
jgi:hypothetical protein